MSKDKEQKFVQGGLPYTEPQSKRSIMNTNEILNTVLSLPGATMARANKMNFVIVPTDDGYAKVSVSMALAKDTKNRKAFNAEAAIAEYKAHEAESALREAERANKPAKVNGVNPEAQARRDELDAVIGSLDSFTEYTATDIMNAITGKVAFNLTPMNVGQSAKRLVEKGVLTLGSREGDKKSYYTKA